MSDEVKAKRDALRAATLGTAPVRSSRAVEWGGEHYEVRSPTIAQTRRLANLSKQAGSDDFKALVHGVIQTVYIPGTDERVFNEKDEEALLARGMRDFIGAFARALKELGEEEMEAVEKNSESAPSDSSS